MTGVANEEKNKHLTQPLIDEIVLRFRQNGHLRTNELQPGAARPLNPQQKVYVAGESVPAEQRIMLASVPKPALILPLAQLFDELEVQEFEVTGEVLAEMVGREPKESRKEIYAEVFDLIATPLSQLDSLPDQPEYAKQRKDLMDECNNVLLHYYTIDNPFTIPRTELMRQMLTLSSNSATKVVVDYARQHLPEHIDLDTVLAAELPHFSRNRSTGLYDHWLQDDPNTGILSEFTDYLHKQTNRYVAGEMEAAETEVMRSLINNKEDFGFCFTHSDLGQELIAAGWQIVEKTGYYPCVTWVRSLADAGMPFHMVHATTVSLIPPAGSKQQVTSFSYYQLTEVAPPFARLDVEVDGIKLTFPHEWELDYVMYSKAVRKPVNITFRETVTQKVRQRLTAIDGN